MQSGIMSFSVLRKICILLTVAVTAPMVHAQITQRAPAATPSPAAPSDPLELGRETPRGTVIGFVRAAQSENYDLAVQYFEPRRRTNIEPERELAQQLLEILNARFRVAVEPVRDRKSTRLNSSHQIISYAVFCLKKKNQKIKAQLYTSLCA